jgi:tetratricopeptide (TPR) repeat protein
MRVDLQEVEAMPRSCKKIALPALRATRSGYGPDQGARWSSCGNASDFWRCTHGAKLRKYLPAILMKIMISTDISPLVEPTEIFHNLPLHNLNHMKKPSIIVLILCLCMPAGLMAQQKVKALIKQGWEQFDQSDYEAAFGTAKDILFEDPENAEGFALRGSIYAVYYRYASALEDLDYAITHGSKHFYAFIYHGSTQQYYDRYDEAEADFNKAIALERDNPLGYRMRARLYRDKQDYAAAMADLEHCIKLNPTIAGAHLDKGKLHLRLRQYNQATACFEQVVALDTANYYEPYISLGNCAYDQMRYDQAKAHYLHALELEPKSSSAIYNLGLVAHVVMQYDSALAYFHQSIALDSSFADAYWRIGVTLIEMMQYEAAIAHVDTAIAIGDPEVEYYYLTRGVAKSKMEQYEAAIQDLNRAIVRDLSFAEAYFERGRARLELKAYPKAMEDFRMCIKLNPEMVGAEFNIALVQLRMQQPQLAQAGFVNYLKKEPKDAWGWFHLASAENDLNLYPKAIEHYSKALASKSIDSVQVYYWRGKAYLDAGDSAAANLDLDSSIAMHPTDPKIVSTIGYFLNLLERYPEALDQLNRAIAMDSTFAYAFNNRGFAKYKLGQYESAILDFDKSIALKNDYFYWPPWNRANAKRALGRYDAAIEDFNISLGHRPDHPEALNDRGETWEQLGKTDLAIADYEAALALKPEFEAAKANLKRLKP